MYINRFLYVVTLCSFFFSGIVIQHYVEKDYYEKHPIVKTVQKEVTDEQLAEWWFGETDKQGLKLRICKR